METSPQIKETMTTHGRWFSPGILILVFLLLFMPFVTVSCDGQEIVTSSGFQLATGNKTADGERLDANFWAILFILVVIAGIGLSFWKVDKGPLLQMLVAGIGIALLVALFISIKADVAESAREMREMGIKLKANFKIGYYLSFLMMLLLGAVNFLFVKNKVNIFGSKEDSW